MKRTAGAKHVIQRVVLQEERKQLPPRSSRQRSSRRTTNRRLSVAEPGPSRENRDEEEYLHLDRDEVMQEMKIDTKEELDTDQRVLFIEYMRRGRFDDHIGKVAILKSQFPDLVLWQIFDCCKCWDNKLKWEKRLTNEQCSAPWSAWHTPMPSSLLGLTQRSRTCRRLARLAQGFPPCHRTARGRRSCTLI
jgi:hypothetical protein